MSEINAMDYWWKRAKKAEELLGKIKYEADFKSPQELQLTISIIQDMLKDVDVVKPKRKKKDD